MGRIVKYSVSFSAIAFLCLLALELVFFDVPTPSDITFSPSMRIAIYLGIAAGTAVLISPSIICGALGAVLGLRLSSTILRIRPRVIVASGVLFALALYLSMRPAVRLIGDIPWLIGVVMATGFFYYFVARSIAHRDA